MEKKSNYEKNFLKYKESKKATVIGKNIIPVLLAVCTVVAAAAGGMFFLKNNIPSEVNVFSECEIHNIGIPMVNFEKNDDENAVECMSESKSANVETTLYKVNYEATLLSKIPLKNVSVNVLNPNLELCPGGMNFGVMLNTKGVLIVGMSDVSSGTAKSNPAYNAGIRIKDIITSINGIDVNSVNDVINAVKESEGKQMHFELSRGDENFGCDVTAQKGDDGEYKLGLWIRDSTAGIGTVTFIIPDSNVFAGLGHGIYDVDTSQLLPMIGGDITEVKISGINKGRPGSPGELKGYFSSGKIGSLLKNSETGVYGTLDELSEKFSTNEKIGIALKDEIYEGDAIIRCAVDGEVKEYNVAISQISRDNKTNKNFEVEVTDPDLINLTGGIVQGMSGSPIIQNGHLVGAVTHVMINDPTTGYGIFIENMLNSLPGAS